MQRHYAYGSTTLTDLLIKGKPYIHVPVHGKVIVFKIKTQFFAKSNSRTVLLDNFILVICLGILKEYNCKKKHNHTICIFGGNKFLMYLTRITLVYSLTSLLSTRTFPLALQFSVKKAHPQLLSKIYLNPRQEANI